MKRILLLLAAVSVMLGTACGQPSRAVPAQQTADSDAAAEPADGTDTAAAESAETASAPEQTVPSADTTLTTGEQTVTDTQTETTEAATSVTVQTAGIGRRETPDTAALEQDVKKYKRNCAVLLESLDGTTLYSYHPDTLIPGASLIKLPYVYFCCTQIDAGKFKLTDTVTYAQKYKQGGAGVVSESAFGTEFTLKELMEYTLRYSDNTAYYMLVETFGTKGFNQMTADWGHARIRLTVSARFPALTASFVRAAMKKMYAKRADGECWENAWSALVNSKRSYAREIIGGTDDIAVKYGSLDKQYHEAILVDGDKPYVLVLLSGAVNYDPDEAFVKKVIADAKEIADAYNASN